MLILKIKICQFKFVEKCKVMILLEEKFANDEFKKKEMKENVLKF